MLLFLLAKWYNRGGVEVRRNEDDHHWADVFTIFLLSCLERSPSSKSFLFLEDLHIFLDLFTTSSYYFNRWAWDDRSWLSQYTEDSVQHWLRSPFYFRFALVFFLSLWYLSGNRDVNTTKNESYRHIKRGEALFFASPISKILRLLMTVFFTILCLLFLF